MQEDHTSREKGNTLTVAVSMKDPFQKVVVTEIESDGCLTSKDLTSSNRLHEDTDQKTLTSSVSISQSDSMQIQDEMRDQSQQSEKESIVIITSNEVYKDDESLRRCIDAYGEVQGASLISEIDEHALQDSVGIGGRARTQCQSEDRDSLLSNHTSNELHTEQKDIFDAITTLPTSSEPTQQTQHTTYLSSQTLGQIQSMPSHTLLNAGEVLFDTVSQGAHYIINGPPMHNINALQSISQQGTGQVVLLQVPTTQVANQLMVTQVSNGNMQSTLGTSPVVSVHQSNVEALETSSAKKQRSKGGNKTKAKRLKQDSGASNLRPLAPRMLAVPISSPLVIAASNGAPQVYTTMTPMDHLQQMTAVPSSHITRTGGQHFEVLGRCVGCFRFCRTTTYCRAEKNHTDVRAAACSDCETKGYSTVVCRRRKQHKGPNAYPPNIVINTASSLSRTADLKDMCVKNLLPPCFSELHSLTVHHADCIFAQPRNKIESEDQLLTINGSSSGENLPSRKSTDYARGYLYPYSKETWEQWLSRFCAQTGTSYRIRTGKRVNKKSDHGLANHNGKIVVFRALESQLHNCALGGKPRKKAIREGSKRRKARGSKLIGCSAVIHTRLIVTEEDWKALEITVPKLSAHLPVHDPRISGTEIANDINSMLIPDSLYDSEQGVSNQSQDEYAIIDDVGFHNEQETELTNEQMQLINSLHIGELKKQTKNLITICGDLLDDVSNFEALKAAHLQLQTLYNDLLPTNSQKRHRKRSASEAGLVQDEEVLEEGESRTQPVGQVVLLQTEQV